MTPIAGIGIELWTMSDSIYFDNILITDSIALADGLAKETYDLKMSVIDAMSGNMFKRILDYSNKNPWLYAVYVVLVGLPTVLIITFCCSGSGDKTGEGETGDKSSLNDPKKTDEPQEDDEVAEEEAAAQEEAEADGSDGEEEEEGDEEEEEGEDEPPTTRSQTRKRRPRKEL
jgi:calnexin